MNAKSKYGAPKERSPHLVEILQHRAFEIARSEGRGLIRQEDLQRAQNELLIPKE